MNREEILNLSAGPETDKLIGEKVMGWHLIPEEDIEEEDGMEHWAQMWLDENNRIMCNSFLPSINIFDAWMVVEKFVEQDCKFNIYRYGNWNKKENKKVWQCYMGDSKYNLFPFANADTASLAICRAALLAVMETR